MQALFEKSDFITSPFEAFLFDSKIAKYPVVSHWHYFCEIIYVTSGNAEFHDEENSYPVKEGDLIFIHPEFIHGISGTEPVTFKVLKFDLSLLKSAGSHISNFPKAILSGRKQITAPIIIPKEKLVGYNPETAFSNCIREINDMSYGYDLCIQAELTDLLTHILRYWHSLGFRPEEITTTVTVTNPFHKVVEYIDENLSQQIKVEDLAIMCNMSYSHFAKEFHQVYGHSCKDYITLQRIRKVKDLLLLTNYDLNYICQETGFADCSHLIRTFKKSEGITPKKYRMQN